MSTGDTLDKREHDRISGERPKSAPYLSLKKTPKRKPLFLQLETTKALNKLKIEKKIRICFDIFLEFPVSRIVSKNVKGGTLWDFLNIHSVAKYQKLMGGTIKKIREKISLTVPKKGGKSHSVEKSAPFCFGMAFYLMLEALDALKMKY